MATRHGEIMAAAELTGHLLRCGGGREEPGRHGHLLAGIESQTTIRHGFQ